MWEHGFSLTRVLPHKDRMVDTWEYESVKTRILAYFMQDWAGHFSWFCWNEHLKWVWFAFPCSSFFSFAFYSQIVLKLRKLSRIRGLARWRDKQKPLYLYYHSVYGHQTWQDDNVSWGAPTYKSHFSSITWSFKITWQVKAIISSLHSACGHQIWLNGDMPWGVPNHKVIQRLDHVVLQGQVANENHYISTTRVPMAEDDNLIWWAPTYKSHDPLITWYYQITWKTKTIISPIPQCLWPPNLLGWWLTL